MASSTLSRPADKIAAGYYALVVEFTAANAALKNDKTPHGAALSAAYAAFASGYAAAGAAADVAGAEEAFPLLPLTTQRDDLSPLDVMTLSQTAAYLQLSEAETRTEAVAGRLVGRAIGDDWRFVREDVLKWVRTPRLAPALRPELMETEEEFEAFLAILREKSDALDRATKSGKYAEDE